MSGKESEPVTDAGPGEREPGAGGDAGDGWIAGAWSAEGWVSATTVGPDPEPEDDETPVAAPRGADAASEPGESTIGETADDATAGDLAPDAAVDAAVDAEADATDSAVDNDADGKADRTADGDTDVDVPPVAAEPVIARHAAAAGAAAGTTPTALSGEPTPAPARESRPTPAPSRPRPRPDAATAAELTEDAIVRFRGDRPTQGWRGTLYGLTGGLINPGIGPVERARQEQLRRIRRPLPGSHQIAVSSIKGGVGKTSVAACLGLVLAENRGDRVIALDANPDAGTLADRLTSEVSVTVRHLLDNIEATHSLTDVARYTSLAGRLQVLASEQDPAMSEAFNREEYERVCEVLTRFYNIVITDSGTGLVHSAMEGTLALADSLVVVGAPTVDGASRASKTLDWLIAHGHAARVANAVVVLSCDRVSREVDRARVREHFEARCRAVVEVPHDPHLATGGRIELSRLKPATHDAFLELAAHLADEFGAGQRPVEVSRATVPSYP
ncbi:MinD/ParA family protein [Pseudonocardia acidicola]|uniref:MinD/ParA family ATP-binding protein n=1 Tax=Pseudonocardia acidicola TaxID=2724939 RepID=UPI003083F8DB